MASAKSPVVPPSERTPRGPIVLERDDTGPTDHQDTPGTTTRDSEASDCEDEVSRDADVDGEDVSRNSAQDGQSDAESEDPTKTDARRAVISAIEKMERFQEAVRFNIVEELHDLKSAVSGLEARGRPDGRYPERPSPEPGRSRSRSPYTPAPPRMPPPNPFASPRTLPRGLPRGLQAAQQIEWGVEEPRRRLRRRPVRRAPSFEEIVIERRVEVAGSSSGTSSADEKEGILPACLVERLNMEDWRRRNRSASPEGYYGGRRGPQRRGPPPPPGRRGPPPRHGKRRGSDASSEIEADYVVKAYYRNVPTKISSTDNMSTDDDFKRAYTQGRNREKPSRVEISSEIVVEELQEITGLTFEDDPFVMIPPYKLLTYNSAKISARLTTLKEELSTKGLEFAKAALAREELKKEQSPPEEADADARESKKRHKVKERLEWNEKVAAKQAFVKKVAHMQCLVDFIKTDLAYLVGLRLKIQEASIDKIAFEDLYYLFQPGDFIVNAQSKSRQLYQCYSVSGGRVRLEKNRNAMQRGRSPADSDSDAYFAGSGVGTWTSLVIDSYLLAWDGERLSTMQVTNRIKHFIGEKKITDLDIFPVRFLAEADALREDLRERGKKLIACSGHKKYHGPTVEKLEDKSRRFRRPYRYGSPPPRVDRPVFEEIESDVYVDTKTYYQRYDDSAPSSKLRRTPGSRRETTETFGKYERPILSGDHDVDDSMTDDFINANRHLLYPSKPEEMVHVPSYTELIPYQLPAYEFRARRWVWLNIENVTEIDKSEEARKSGWKELVIPEKYSQLLVSLVDNHTSGFDNKKGISLGGAPSVQIDLVRGKGRGLIILLHGPPGSGKTSTSETIASYTGRPLYSITCGDIGTTADEVEDRLQDHTELAEKWGCVLLLDEADVFLMRRAWNDMQRNALVSVFLRHLEYYSGILFLTTNIVGVIDEAFKSRIHVALRYPAIDLDSTKKMWNNVLDRIERDNATAAVPVEFNRATLLDFASAHYRRHETTDSTWNGRQVRNAFQIAIALGQYERLTRVKDEGLSLDAALASKNKKLTTVRLTKRNFLNIASTARDFEDYISSIRGSDSSVARANQHRDDDYGRAFQKAQKAYPVREPAPERPQPQARAGAGRDPYVTPTSGRPAARPAGRDERASAARAREEADLFEGGLVDDEDDEDDEETHEFDE